MPSSTPFFFFLSFPSPLPLSSPLRSVFISPHHHLSHRPFFFTSLPLCYSPSHYLPSLFYSPSPFCFLSFLIQPWQQYQNEATMAALNITASNSSSDGSIQSGISLYKPSSYLFHWQIFLLGMQPESSDCFTFSIFVL